MDFPIIFSAPMVQALIDGRKTMTRRLLWSKREPGKSNLQRTPFSRWDGKTIWTRVKVGDRLWVRENLAVMGNWGVWHDATDTPRQGQFLDDLDPRGKVLLEKYAPADALTSTLIPSIHMPRWASRLTLVVTATRTERLLCGSLGAGDAECEGLIPVLENGTKKWRAFANEPAYTDPTIAFNVLWDRLHGKGAFFANPEVVVLTFTTHQRNIDALAAAA